MRPLSSLSRNTVWSRAKSIWRAASVRVPEPSLIGQGILPDGVLHLIAQMAARREDGFEGGFGNRSRFGEQGLHGLPRFLGDQTGRRRRRLNGHERGPLYAARRVTGGFPHRIRDEEQDGRQQGGQNRSLERPGCVWIRIRQVHATRGQPFPQCGETTP